MIVDLIIVVLILMLGLYGYKKGLSSSILKIASLAISIVIALVLYKPISSIIIEKTPLSTTVENAISDFIVIDDSTNEVKAKESAPNAIQSYINNAIEEANKTAQTAVKDSIVRGLSNIVIQICTLIILAVVVRIILMIIKSITDVVTDIPVIKQVNEIGGLAYGIVEALIIILVVFTVISFINNQTVIESINKSFIGSMLYDNNIILNLFVR